MAGMAVMTTAGWPDIMKPKNRQHRRKKVSMTTAATSIKMKDRKNE
jgi:hypothetical protein